MGQQTYAASVSRICMLKLNLLSFIVPEISTFIRTGGHGQIDLAIDTEQKYIYFTWLEAIHFACYILFNELCVPFHSTSNGYKNRLNIKEIC